MQTSLIGRYLKEGYGDSVVYDEIVAAYVHDGALILVARTPDNTLYKRAGIDAIVVELKSVPADGIK